jgi:hypothetical protein
VKEQLRLQFAELDPIQLLREIRRLQAALVAKGQAGESDPSHSAEETAMFVRSLRRLSFRSSAKSSGSC